MPLSIDELTATPRTIELGGRSLRLAPLTMEDLGALQAWIHSQLPDPIAVAHRLAAGMPESVQEKILNRAFDHAMAARKTHMIGTDEADQVLASMEGFVQILALMCRAHHPDMTPAALALLVGGLDETTINAVTRHAFGMDPSDRAGAGDPKAPAAGADGDAAAAAPSTTRPSS